MSLLESLKSNLEEAAKKEANQGVKESLLAIGGSLLVGVGVYLYGTHMGNTGRHLGRLEILDALSETAEKLDSLDVRIDKN